MRGFIDWELLVYARFVWLIMKKEMNNASWAVNIISTRTVLLHGSRRKQNVPLADTKLNNNNNFDCRNNFLLLYTYEIFMYYL